MVTAEEYFLAGRETPFWAVGLALFASNIGSEHFVGLAGSGAKLGMCVSWGEWLSPLCILLLGWVFVPYYLQTDIYTMPEFLQQRYSRGLRIYYAVLLLMMYVFTKVSVALYAGAIVLQVTLGWDIMTSAVILVVATGAYTTLGGMKAVIHTECLQSVVLIAGGLLLLGFALQRVGGGATLLQGGAALWHELPDSHLHLFQPPSHHEFPWTGVLFGMPFTSVWYWCTDQNVVQRVLAAKSLAHARAGAVLAASLKILPPFMMVVPGMVARVLYREQMEDSEEVGWPNLFSPCFLLVFSIRLAGCRFASCSAPSAVPRDPSIDHRLARLHFPPRAPGRRRLTPHMSSLARSHPPDLPPFLSGVFLHSELQPGFPTAGDGPATDACVGADGGRHARRPHVLCRLYLQQHLDPLHDGCVEERAPLRLAAGASPRSAPLRVAS